MGRTLREEGVILYKYYQQIPIAIKWTGKGKKEEGCVLVQMGINVRMGCINISTGTNVLSSITTRG